MKNVLIPLAILALCVPVFTSAVGQAVPVLDEDNLEQNTRIADLLELLLTKELQDDQVAQATAQQKMGELAKETLNFISTGANGQPVFVENLVQFKTDLIKNVQKDVLGDNFNTSQLNNLPDYMGEAVWGALKGQQNQFKDVLKTAQDSASGISKVSKEFVEGDFSSGGWDAWFNLTQDPQQNPYTAYLNAEAALTKQIASAINDQETKLNWYDGFLPGLEDPEKILGNITIPGSTYKQQLENVLGSSVRFLEQADEYAGIVGEASAAYSQFSSILQDPTTGISNLLSKQDLGSIFKFTTNFSFNFGGFKISGGF